MWYMKIQIVPGSKCGTVSPNLSAQTPVSWIKPTKEEEWSRHFLWAFMHSTKPSDHHKCLDELTVRLPPYDFLFEFYFVISSLLTVCLPLISSIKPDKSNHIFPYPFLPSVFCQAFLIHVWETLTRLAHKRVNHSAGEFILTLAFPGCRNAATLLLGWQQLCSAYRLLSRSFVPSRQSHHLTHSLQNTL